MSCAVASRASHLASAESDSIIAIMATASVAWRVFISIFIISFTATIFALDFA